MSVGSCQSEAIKAWRQGSIAFLQLNRPEKSNAYSQPMLAALAREIERAAADPDCRILVITGTGQRAFCAGADLDEIQSREWQDVWQLRSAQVFGQLNDCRLVTVAACNGACVGGGLELALACDIRLAADTARFWLPEPELGLIPAAGGTQRLPAVVGKARAKELILGGAVWNSADALRFGLVSEVVPAAELMECVERWCQRIARRSPAALEFAKRAIDLHDSQQDCGHRFERAAQALLGRLQAEAESERDS